MGVLYRKFLKMIFLPTFAPVKTTQRKGCSECEWRHIIFLILELERVTDESSAE